SYRALEIALDAYFEKLIKAVEQDDMSQTAHMIKTGFPITMRDSQGNNLLHRAAQAGSSNVFKYLLKENSKLITHQNKQRLTPLDVMHDNIKPLLLSLLQ
nr:ankyrin repeat domain-containing protein [Candidatus Dependentiae bacterium]